MDGGAGNDTLFFSRGDDVTGGAGTDEFNLIAERDDEEAEVAIVNDFDPATETLTIYHDFTEAPADQPALTTDQDVDGNFTSILLDGIEVMRIAGLVPIDPSAVTLVQGLSPTESAG